MINIMTEEVRKQIQKRTQEILTEYDYCYYDNYVKRVLDGVINAKAPLISRMANHPYWNGKGQIVIPASFERVMDVQKVRDFRDWCNDHLPDYVYKYWTYEELEYIIDSLKTRIGKCKSEYDRNELEIELIKFTVYKETLSADSLGFYCSNGAYRHIDYRLNCMFNRFIEDEEATLNEETLKFLNELYPNIRFGVGQKLSKVIGRVCTKVYGLDNVNGYNSAYAKVTDATNPETTEYTFVMSANLNDYLTMSFGANWASCHTIDKNNKRGMPNNYSGCYSSGTLSYALDPSSVICYTIKPNYKGEPEDNPKINRCVFNISEDGERIIQGRMYPQDCDDGCNSLYKTFRCIVQKIISDIFEIPNYWDNRKGTNECVKNIASYGTHYNDYRHYGNCNVSYLKGKEPSSEKIKVGHRPICFACGREHDYEENILCPECCGDAYTCENCGCCIDEDEVRWIGDYTYCPDCTCYCRCCDEAMLIDNGYWSENDNGYICEDCYENHYTRCEKCGKLVDVDYSINTDDYYSFCCEECARENGYELTDDTSEWTLDWKICECCGYVVALENYNDEKEKCVGCIEDEKED